MFITYNAHALQLAMGAVTKAPSRPALQRYIADLQEAWINLKREIEPLETRLNILEANALDFAKSLADASEVSNYGRSKDSLSKAQRKPSGPEKRVEKRKMEDDLREQVDKILSAINTMKSVVQKKNKTLVSMKSDLDERKYDLEQMGGMIAVRGMLELWPYYIVLVAISASYLSINSAKHIIAIPYPVLNEDL